LIEKYSDILKKIPQKFSSNALAFIIYGNNKSAIKHKYNLKKKKVNYVNLVKFVVLLLMNSLWEESPKKGETPSFLRGQPLEVGPYLSC
jgi:hypothetical protein